VHTSISAHLNCTMIFLAEKEFLMYLLSIMRRQYLIIIFFETSLNYTGQNRVRLQKFKCCNLTLFSI
jgi:hypothetical protein